MGPCQVVMPEKAMPLVLDTPDRTPTKTASRRSDR